MSLHATSTGKVLLAWSRRRRTSPACSRAACSGSPTPRSRAAAPCAPTSTSPAARATRLLRRRVRRRRPAASRRRCSTRRVGCSPCVSVWGRPRPGRARPVPGPRRPHDGGRRPDGDRPEPTVGQTAAASAARRSCCWRRAQRLGGEDRQREPDQREADPLHRGHRLVEDEQAEQELDRRREVLQQPERGHRDPDGGGAEADQRDGGDQAGGAPAAPRAPGPVAGEASTGRRRRARPGSPAPAGSAPASRRSATRPPRRRPSSSPARRCRTSPPSRKRDPRRVAVVDGEDDHRQGGDPDRRPTAAGAVARRARARRAARSRAG